MKKATGIKKLGRPKKAKTTYDTIFVGLKMPEAMANALKKDASKNFRMRGQHILWILSDYIVRKIHFKGISKSDNLPKERPINEPLYTEEELEDMYKEHKENK